MCGRVCIRMYAGRTRGCVRMMRNMYNSCATTSVRMCWDETKKSQTTNHTNRRGRPWKYKVGTVWSVVCAMNLGLFSEKSLKDVSFVSLWDVFVKKRFSKDGLQDLQTSNVLEHKLCDQMNASSRYWPFIHEARSTIALAKSVRNRTKKRRKRVPWTLTRRQTKRNDEAPKLPHRRANDNRKTPVATNFALQTRERSRVVSEGSMTTGSSGYNFSFRQLHSRLPNENGRGTCQPANEREARRATWKGFSEDFGQVDYSGSKYSESRPSVPERTESRGRTNRSERPEYFRNVMRTADKDENEKSTKRKTCKEVSSNGRNESKKKYRILLLAKRRQILEQNRKKRWKGRRTKSTANDKALCVSQKRRNTAVVNTQENVKHTRKNCEFNAQQRSYDFIDASSYKENLRSTATAIMQDIQEQIRNEGSSIDLGNTDDTIYESAVDSPTEKQDDDLNRDISMEYEWVDQDSEFINGNSFQGSEQSIRAMPRVSSMYVNRRKTGKKKSRKTAIDCEFVDRTETTYQNDFHECIDLESSASIPPLKINVDENRGSEDSDVGTIHSTWPRSSLTEGYSNEFDSALPLARKIINDGSTTGSERCYVYRETPDVSPSIQRDESGNDSITDSFALTRSRYRTRNVEDRKQINERDAMKEVITYGKRNKNNDRSLTTDRTSSTGDKNGHSKVQAKSSADSIKSYDSDSNNDNKYSLRRKTRSSIKDTKENSIGKLVWGNCSGWWPALIIDAEQVGMAPESGKTWVYWIGESQISLLNDKTQIEPFSRKLESRLTQQFRKNNTRSHAIDETIKMLRQRYECTLTKPYYYWIRRNIAKMEELDHLNFYPYSDKIQHRLDDLKEQNYKATKQHMLNQRNGSPEPAKKQMVEKAKDTKAWKQMEDERLPLQEQLPGVITWAKIAGHNWWPAMIVDYRDCCLKEPGFGCQWIMWYGDYTVSQVHHLAFLRFHKGITKLREYIENTKKHVYLVGVLQASKDYCSRLGCNTDNWTLDNVFRYFSDMNNIHVPYKNLQVSESNKVYDKYSNEIVNKINELKADTNVDSKRKDDIDKSAALRRVMRGEIGVEKICLRCLKLPNDEMEEHPFFVGSLCKECSNIFKPCMFVFGSDDKCFYCTVCATTGTVVICDRADCPRVYCTACLKFLICPEGYDDMLLEDPWECFLCKSRLPANGLLQPRANWKEKVIGMFRTTSNSISNDIVVNNSDKKRGVRVLSLFDGLGTGLVVLLKLGIDVDVYYASEIDEDALMVSSAHFGDRITYLGDVRGITKEKIKEIAPIDLLIGGSPCNDLSLVNPARLGLHDPKGTGVLFFEYCRIMKQLKKINKGHHMFWLFENVASMPSEYRLEMNKHLGQEPMVIDSADYSPQHRLRLYWHNIPHDPYLPLMEKQYKQDVQDILTPHCNRYALVKKIRTVTTKTFSLRQISGKSELKPIMMKGESDSIWITELEEIFGFPRHYTDVKNLSATSRQKLIGKSWSVQTLSAILRPLCSYFKCNEDNMK